MRQARGKTMNEKQTQPTLVETNNLSTESTDKRLPEKRFTAGAIHATIWQNTAVKDGKEGHYNTVCLERVYKDKKGNWQSSNSFSAHDLPKLSLVTQKAYEYVTFQKTPAV